MPARRITRGGRSAGAPMVPVYRGTHLATVRLANVVYVCYYSLVRFVELSPMLWSVRVLPVSGPEGSGEPPDRFLAPGPIFLRAQRARPVSR